MKRILGWIIGTVVVAVAVLGITWLKFAPPQDLRGVWKTDGYGLVLDVGPVTIDVYQVSDIHCTMDQTIPAHMWLVDFLEGVTLAHEADQMVLNVAGTLNPIYADPIDALPTLCATPVANNPTAVFDVMWEVMNTHYAHFDTHGVDWNARRALRPAPGASMDDDALMTLMQDALTGLDDGHTYIATGDTIWSPSEPTDWHDSRHMVRDNTLAAVADLSPPSETGLRVGWATPDIGYIFMTHMDPDTGIGQRADVFATEAMRQALDYLAPAKGIILDVRYNPGGSDDVSLAYASHFTDTALPVFTKTTRTETGYTVPYTATLTPTAIPTDTPIVVLTTPYTGSAAEIFTIAMRTLPQVTVMGMPTSGGLSDIMSIALPNEWELGFSHQVYLTMDGEDFERVGVPPDVFVDVDVAAAKDGRDAILEAAIAQLQSP
jgi:hypothetical protein